MSRNGPKAYLSWSLAVHISSGHVGNGYYPSCCVICHLEKMLESASETRNKTTLSWIQTRCQNYCSTSSSAIPSATKIFCPACLHATNSKIFKTFSPCTHLHLSKGRASWVFLHSSFQNSRFTFTFQFLLFLLQFSFCVLLITFHFYSFHLHLQNTPVFYFLHFHKQTTLKKGRDIIPDIFNKVLTRAFWRQNYFTFNKPAPFGAKMI